MVKARIAECHPEEPHWGGGKCKKCYQRDWWRAHGFRGRRDRKREKKPRPENQGRTLWPQELVRGIPRGWGSLT
jgi:hypothetical protein